MSKGLERQRRSVGESRRAIRRTCERLKRFFVGRDEVIDLMALALLAREPMLLLGPPGTAKSDLLVKFSQAIGLSAADYFEYMVTAFTEPSEILGPVDIAALREEGIYRRNLTGKLGDAAIVFLDEIFNGNSAILNTLLTVMNERKIYDGGQPIQLDRLEGFFAATNEIPERTDLMALRDRFTIKVELRPVQSEHFDALIGAGTRNELYREAGDRPWVVEDAADLSDFERVRTHLSDLLRTRYEADSDGAILPARVHRLFRQLIADLASRGVVLSDRQVIKVHRLIVFRAFLFDGRKPDGVVFGDLSLLRYVADSQEMLRTVAECVDHALGEVD